MLIISYEIQMKSKWVTAGIMRSECAIGLEIVCIVVFANRTWVKKLNLVIIALIGLGVEIGMMYNEMLFSDLNRYLIAVDVLNAVISELKVMQHDLKVACFLV